MRTRHLLTRASFASLVIGGLFVASCSSGTDVTDGGDAGAAGDAGPSEDGGGASTDGSASDSSPQDAGSGDGADAGNALASPLDPTFGVSGLVTTAMRDSNEDIYDLLRTPDGKAIVVGRSFGNDRAFAMRFTATGALDTTFGVGGKVLLEPAITLPPVLVNNVWRNTTTATIQSTGKPIIAGITGPTSGFVIRLNVDGTVDATFGAAGRVALDFAPGEIIADANDKILVAGGNLDETLASHPLVVTRLSATGAVDTTFGTAGRTSHNVVFYLNGKVGRPFPNGIAFDAAGDLWVLGRTLQTPLTVTSDRAFQVELTPAGTVGADSTWPTPSYSPTAHKLAFRPNGGERCYLNAPSMEKHEDITCTPNGVVLSANVRYGVERFIGDETGLLVLSPAGISRTTEPNYGTTFGAVAPAAPRDMFREADGSFVVAGITPRVDGTRDIVIGRTTAAGAIDTTYATNGSTTTNMNASFDEALAVAVQPDGKILAGGFASVGSPNAGDGFALARYTAAGVLDTTFGAGGKLFASTAPYVVRGIAVDGAGNIVVGGGRIKCSASRFTAGGSLDTTFGSAGTTQLAVPDGSDPDCNALAVDATGRVLLAGSAESGAQLLVSRLDADGNVDATFGTSGYAFGGPPGAGCTAFALAVQPDGKILAAGSSKVGDHFDLTLTRFDATGVLDATFGSGGVATTDATALVAEHARAIELQPDGKILVAASAGSTPTISPDVRSPDAQALVLRYNADGSLDTTFATAGKLVTKLGAVSATPFTIKRRTDGRIWVGGILHDGKRERAWLARLDANGSFDTTFGSGGVYVDPATAESSVRAIAIQPDGKLLAAGRAFRNPTGNDFALLRLEP